MSDHNIQITMWTGKYKDQIDTNKYSHSLSSFIICGTIPVEKVLGPSLMQIEWKDEKGNFIVDKHENKNENLSLH